LYVDQDCAELFLDQLYPSKDFGRDPFVLYALLQNISVLFTKMASDLRFGLEIQIHDFIMTPR